MIRYLIHLAPGLLSAGLSLIGLSLISDCVQSIKIGPILSDSKKVLYGVPQGTRPGANPFFILLFR